MIRPSIKNLKIANKSFSYFKELLAEVGIRKSPSEFVSSMMNRFDEKFKKSDQSDSEGQVNRYNRGFVFEYVIGEILCNSGAVPLNYRTKLSNEQRIVFDWFLFDTDNPIAISCATLVKDKWAIAAFSGFRLKTYFPKAKHILITNSHENNDWVNDYKGYIDSNIVVTDKSFNNLIDELAKEKYQFTDSKLMPTHVISG